MHSCVRQKHAVEGECCLIAKRTSDLLSLCRYMVMLHCWSRRPTSRPTFTDLEKTLSSLLSKSGADDHIDIEALSKSVNVPLRKRPSSVSQVS